MKRIILLLTIVVVAYSQVYSQRKVDKSTTNALSPCVHYPIDVQLKMFREFVLQYYGKAFKYYDELKNGKYVFTYSGDKKSTEQYVVINDRLTNKEVDKIKLKKKKRLSDQNIDFDRYQLERLVNGNAIKRDSPRDVLTLNLIEKDSIFKDHIIISNGGLPLAYWTKIFNASYQQAYIKDQNGNDFNMYNLCVAGSIIPYNGGQDAKVLTLDNQFHDIVYYDWATVNNNQGPVLQSSWYCDHRGRKFCILHCSL